MESIDKEKLLIDFFSEIQQKFRLELSYRDPEEIVKWYCDIQKIKISSQKKVLIEQLRELGINLNYGINSEIPLAVTWPFNDYIAEHFYMENISKINDITQEEWQA